MSKNYAYIGWSLSLLVILSIFFLLLFSIHEIHDNPIKSPNLIVDPLNYHDDNLPVWEQLSHRVKMQPINLIFLFFFILAIIHTFLANHFALLAHKKMDEVGEEEIGISEEEFSPIYPIKVRKNVDFFTEMLGFIGKLEVVFGFWCIPLLAAITFGYGWKTTINYVNSEYYSEALYVIIAMAVSTTYPLLRFGEKFLGWFAKIGGSSCQAWWLTILTVGPLMGSLVKETIAMTISSLLLVKFFYAFKPSKNFAYATLGLLFVNISVGGLLTNFASPAVKVAADYWGWDTTFMFTTFGWKSILGIFINNLFYYFIFYKELRQLEENRIKQISEHEESITPLKVPFWITAVHIFFLAWLAFNHDNIVIAMGSFVLFLGFYQATINFQSFMNLKEPILVGFFLASLVVFAGLQSWWLGPLISHFTEYTVMKIAILLSSVSNNTTINLLASHTPYLTDTMKYAIFSGTMLGGGLTLMGNGPNLAGYTLVSKFFGYNINFLRLFLAALLPTVILYLIFRYL